MKKFFTQKNKKACPAKPCLPSVALAKLGRSGGYTLLETLVAVSLFLVVVTIGVGALLNANNLHQKSQSMRSIMDNLSFVMDDMGRNLRTGYNYYCIPSGGGPSFPDPSPLSGQNCAGIEFEPAGGGNPWAYEFYSSGSGVSFIRKSVYDPSLGWVWVQMTPNEVVVNPSVYPFSVLGAEAPSCTQISGCARSSFTGNLQQPFVTIRLVGSITVQGVVTPFSLQTSVSQRVLNTPVSS